ncbi:MAG: alpha-ketoacid dehydrogenase subunit beta [Gammaproteobacteria bacterium]|nr:alpha-ketoacid dehydrogenase subunit beta [Gammaproteobacteria bacterium]
MKMITFADAINEALDFSLSKDKLMICYGLGVTDPKAVFGTTKGLEQKFGKNRVFDMPTSENAMTGVGIGASLNGVRSVVTHQRLDFFLLAMDQLVNGAAKYYYMYGSQKNVPITIRLVIGRGWGQGPTHSQNLQAWFSHIPGLKVVMPSTPEDAKTLLISSIFDPNPVIYLEHRWLHNSKGRVSEDNLIEKIGNAKILRKGKDITIVSMSYMTIESIRAAEFLSKEMNVDVEVIDLRSVKPIDWITIFKSVEKTGRIIVVDSGFTTGSIAGEIIARVSMERFNYLKVPPARLAMPDVPEPTSFALTKGFYIGSKDITKLTLKILNIEISENINVLDEPEFHDIPGPWFKGPF